MKNISFKNLKPTEFEQFSYDLLDSIGFVNLDWKKGTNLQASPADQGRDIVGQIIKTDIDGSKSIETWFIECKHHSKTIPPIQLQNLLSWAEAEKPHTALFIVSGFLSNPAKEYLEKYKRHRKPPFNIKVWERPSIEKLCKTKRVLLRKYDLLSEYLRKIDEIILAEQELFEKAWYDHHQIIKMGNFEVKEDIWKKAKEAAKMIEKKYGKKNLGPYSDFEWGMLSGKLSAIRWVLGNEWDFLDT